MNLESIENESGMQAVEENSTKKAGPAKVKPTKTKPPKKAEDKIEISLLDLAIIALGATCVAFAFHAIIVPNGFAPGGIGGIAAMAAKLSGVPMTIWLIVVNVPLCLLMYFKIQKSAAVKITLYLTIQISLMALLDFFKAKGILDITYTTDNVILPAIAGGVLSGVGFAVMLRRFGVMSGTYIISTLIKKRKPSANVVWISFGLDCSVVFLAFFVYDFNVDPVLCTTINLFIANQIIDIMLQGLKSAYKFEIFTDEPEELAKELIDRLGHGVSLLPAIGMYSHEPRNLLICVVRRRQVSDFQKIIKAHPRSFAYITNVREVMGYFK